MERENELTPNGKTITLKAFQYLLRLNKWKRGFSPDWTAFFTLFFENFFFLLLHFHSVCYFIPNHFACKWIRNSIKLWHEVFMGITPTRDNWKRLHFYLKCFAAVLRLNFRFEDRYWIESGLRNSASDWRKTEWHCTD